MRKFFFGCLVFALILNSLSLFVGGHPGIETDEVIVIVADILILIAVVLVGFRGRVFTRGQWQFNKKDKENPTRILR